ncbi:hypothetical protein LCM4577_09020 [Mesorhizobium sp. LCM 4577]|uniref:Copper-binding protein n=1 Tax=Mesorhizobium plurifarium TaxID=69974 RepID=A0A090EU05_MESPL|nr:hypothetical protein [Mesorhizobium sp. LCM 4577]OHV66174.1 hypothetical protein LCM4577_09020 [Mesorhizobium sp. LCM 4577]CDX32811.1 conserved exported hypothetical protein [Mesorhizobium plurifarium]
MTINRTIAFAVLVGLAVAPLAASADDDTPKVTRSSKTLPELVLGSDKSSYDVNRTDFELIAGQGYRWKITSHGGFEYKFMTDLWRNVWIDQIVINDLEVHMAGAPAWLEFDDAGTILVQFHTVRPGEYSWSVPDLADKGLKGKITIK